MKSDPVDLARDGVDNAFYYLMKNLHQEFVFTIFEKVPTIGRDELTRKVVNRLAETGVLYSDPQTLKERKYRRHPFFEWLRDAMPDLKFMMVTFMDPYSYLETDDDDTQEICTDESDSDDADDDA
jgi:hypothetical protein